MPDIYYCLTQDQGNSSSERKKLEHLAGLGLLSICLKDQLGFSPNEIRLEYGRFGKPALPDYPQIHFNISHCRGLVVCAAAAQPIGIDCEGIRNVSEALIRKVLTETEQEAVFRAPFSDESQNSRFLQFWTLKEAYSKYSGKGITMDFQSFSFSISDTGLAVCSDPDVACALIPLQPGYVISLCCGKSDQPFSLKLHPINSEDLVPYP